MLQLSAAMLIATAATGCLGQIGDADGLSPPDDRPPAQNRPDFEAGVLTPGPQTLIATPRVIRLTHEQWENTIADLFRTTRPGLSANFTADQRYGQYENNYRRLDVGEKLWGDYQTAAETIATTQVARMATWLPSGLPASGTARRDAFIREFGRRVFRRPLTQAEQTSYASLFDKGDAAFDGGDAFTDGVRITLEAMLQSPNLLYRTELSSNVAGEAIPLSAYEVASRLSYFMWNTMPDDALLAAAESGSINEDTGLKAQLNRLLDDPRAAVALERFHDQTYGLSRYRDLDKDATVFPEWDKDINGDAYYREAVLFLEDLVRNNGTLRDFALSTKTFVNDTLAKDYKLSGTFGTNFVRADLPANRLGFMTRLGFLTANAKSVHPDPIHRGLFLSTELLCRPLAPPPDANTAVTQVGVTNRERYNSVTGKGTCGEGCHGTIINPPGFALEGFDATGVERATDNGHPLVTQGEYTYADGDSVVFDEFSGLMQSLSGAAEYHRCMSSHLVEYFYGREVLQGDMGLVDAIAKDSLDGNATIRSMLENIVLSKGFRNRPLEELAGVTP